MLTHVGRDERIAAGYLVELLNDVLRLDNGAVAVVAQAIAPPP
jgi:hypothetical protein